MIDFSNIEAYRENNRIEAKKALGGLPESIWETYSAFANTLGGVILLGVEEYKDRSLHVVDLPDPEGMIRAFWELVNDSKVASTNILSEEDVQLLIEDGKRFVAITVPPAKPSDMPVYIEGNMMTGSYYRSGDGDYRLSEEEVWEILSDAKRLRNE